MSDNISKLQISQIELEIISDNPAIFQIIVVFDNNPTIEIIDVFSKPKRQKVAKWTLPLFLEHARNIHGNKFDYSQIKAYHIKGRDSHIPLICITCKYEWDTSTANGHINHKTGCPECAGNIPWNLSRFLIRARQIHGTKYNYDKVNESHIHGKNSHIPTTCNECAYDWSPTIHDHINSNSGCPDCAGNAPWTLNRFLIRARRIHNNIYNYDKIKESDIINKESHIDIICTICSYEWGTSTIHHHINGKTGCPDCAGTIPWDLNRFLIRANEIHENKYNYSKILESDIINSWSRVMIECIKCSYEWPSTINNHIHSKSGCPKCRFSKGEIKCSEILDSFNISYLCQYTLSSLPRKRYDFMFIFNNKNYILEYDGKQHFIEAPCFRKSLKETQERDIVKTKVALQENYTMIRIDYTQINNIQYHICKAIQENNSIYYSIPELYSYIWSNL